MASKTEKIVYAKTQLLQKFRKAGRRIATSRKRLPPGQHLTESFPVLDLGIRPHFDPRKWQFQVGGAVQTPMTLGWEALKALPKASQTSDFHCVTTWSKFDVTWGGVKFSEILERVKPTASGRFVIQTCADGYTTNLPMKELMGDDVLLAYELEGAPLPLEHGGPLRLIVPHLYAWKSSKFLTGLTFMEEDEPGYWENLGYHNIGDPWSEDRIQ